MKSKARSLSVKKLMVRLAPVFLIPLFGCSSHHDDSQEKKQAAAPKVIQASVITIESGPVTNTFEALGTVASKVSANVSSKVVGVVKKTNFEAGDSVVAGKLLVQIDQGETAAKLRQAKSQLLEVRRALDEVDSEIKEAEFAKISAASKKTLEEKTFSRYEELKRRQSVSAQEFDDASAKMTAAGADLERAEQRIKSLKARRDGVVAKIEESEAGVSQAQCQLGYLDVTAPFTGLVTQKSVNAGDLAAPGAILLKLEKEDYRLEVPVDESAIAKVFLSESVPVYLGGKQFQATVAEIVPKADPQSRSFTVKLDLPVDCGAKSGTYGRAIFPLGQRQTIAIPAKALVENGQLTYVFAVESTGIASMRVVKTGHSYGQSVEILSGLGSGDRIVSPSTPAISDGMKVETRNQ